MLRMNKRHLSAAGWLCEEHMPIGFHRLRRKRTGGLGAHTRFRLLEDVLRIDDLRHHAIDDHGHAR